MGTYRYGVTRLDRVEAQKKKSEAFLRQHRWRWGVLSMFKSKHIRDKLRRNKAKLLECLAGLENFKLYNQETPPSDRPVGVNITLPGS